MERQEKYNKMLDEDNTMLIEDNEILRKKIATISLFVDKCIVKVANDLGGSIKISTDYFIGQKSILTQIKKML